MAWRLTHKFIDAEGAVKRGQQGYCAQFPLLESRTMRFYACVALHLSGLRQDTSHREARGKRCTDLWPWSQRQTPCTCNPLHPFDLEEPDLRVRTMPPRCHLLRPLPGLEKHRASLRKSPLAWLPGTSFLLHVQSGKGINVQ